MEKVGIFCLDCPIRTRVKSGLDQKPVVLGISSPVTATVARHMLGEDVLAVSYETVDAQGDVSGTGPRVVAPADMAKETVLEAFAECQAPAPSTFQLWKLGIGIGLGQHCMALAAIEEAVHWDSAAQRTQDAQ